MEVYPNPFREQFEVRFEVRFEHSYSREVKIKLVGMDGKVHLEKSIIGNAGLIIKSPYLSQGVYFLHIETPQGTMVQKVIKE